MSPRASRSIAYFSTAYTAASILQRKLIALSALLICILYAGVHWYLGNPWIALLSAGSAIATVVIAFADKKPLYGVCSLTVFFILQAIALDLAAQLYGVNGILLLFPLSSAIFFFFHYRIAIPFATLICATVLMAAASKLEPDVIGRMLVALCLSTIINSAFAYSLAKDRAKVEALAHQDFLTCLPNRRAFEFWLGQSLASCKKNQVELFLAFIDIDKFKSINDRLGHAVGDEVLQAFAGRLLNSIRSQDWTLNASQKVFLARLSGDEFVVAFWGDQSASIAARFDQFIKELNAQPIQIRDYELLVRCSVGIAKASEQNYNLSELLSAADKNMYRAKTGELVRQDGLA